MKTVALLLLLCAPLAYSQQQPAAAPPEPAQAAPTQAAPAPPAPAQPAAAPPAPAEAAPAQPAPAQPAAVPPAPAEAAPAQAAPARTPASTAAGRGPSYSDLYCAGFLSRQTLGKDNYIIGAAESPAQTQFHQGDTIFLEGSGYTEGARFSVLRELRDPNRSRAYPRETAIVSEVGQPYGELGRVRVTAIRGKISIATVEFSCAPMVVGDLLIPFQEKPPVAFRGKTAFDRFPAAEGGLTARIVMAKDFDHVLGTGQKVYISAGADKGVKLGDYFRAVRSYGPAKMDAADALSYSAPQSEETQKYGLKIAKGKYGELPKRALAEMIVINVSPTSSTAMITFAVENVVPGDTVELEGGSQ